MSKRDELIAEAQIITGACKCHMCTVMRSLADALAASVTCPPGLAPVEFANHENTLVSLMDNGKWRWWNQQTHESCEGFPTAEAAMAALGDGT